ncbi:DUF6463 family protein [Deinococcus sp. QL22]|uniref:DUF6463 family protein n=1 Tax=Deinococcus sp. QL22 TaxID=2939437 RepID=UPI002017D955|nr:DUF6463 family protein [Deinococcus sp. QL22]UQN08981.1 DUF6463 family protein [Deinococcus sp. QL22]
MNTFIIEHIQKELSMYLWAGRLLIGVALIHLCLALASVIPHLAVLAPDGLLGVIGAPWHPPHLDRQAAFWSSLGSFAGTQLLWGIWIMSTARAGHRFPRGTGLALLVLTAVQVTLAPLSGFWVNFIPALLLMSGDVPARGVCADQATQ